MARKRSAHSSRKQQRTQQRRKQRKTQRAKHATGQRRVARQAHQIAQQVNSMRLFELLTGPELQEHLEALLPEYRDRQYPPQVTLAMFVRQVLNAGSSCRKAITEALACGLIQEEEKKGKKGKKNKKQGGGGNSSYIDARKRLPQALIEALTRELARLLEQHAPELWLWCGRHVKLVDGSSVTLADTPENQAQFPQPESQKAGAGFPLARVVAVISLAHGALHEVAMGPYEGKGTGEHALLRQLLGCFEKGDVMLADSYYCSFFLIATLMAMGVDFVFEQHGARHTDFRCGERLGAHDHRATWTRPARPAWMSEEEYAGFPTTLTVREVKVDKKILVTSFVTPAKVGKGALRALYLMRWHIELDLRNLKSTLGLEHLRCRSPEMCQKELWAYMLAYNLIRLLMAQAAVHANVSPRQLSFKHTVQTWLAWSQVRNLSDEEDVAALFRRIGAVRVGERPGRVEPRMIKRRPKPFPRLSITRASARRHIRRRGHAKKQRSA